MILGLNFHQIATAFGMCLVAGAEASLHVLFCSLNGGGTPKICSGINLLNVY